MREILFKAKRLDNGEWFEGVPVDVTPLQCFGEPQENDVVMVRAGFADWGMPRGLESTKVDSETVCQYTGLTDKNGKKIFEGDIVHYQYEPGKGFWNVDQNCIVSFRGAGFHIEGIMGTNKYACMSGWLSQLPVGNGEVFEVIGNIHDKEENNENT